MDELDPFPKGVSVQSFRFFMPSATRIHGGAAVGCGFPVPDSLKSAYDDARA